MTRRITIFDTTLRDGEQSPGIALRPEEKAEILRRYEVDYVMLRADSPLREYLEGRPGFTVVDTPGERHILYAVDLRKLPRND